VSKVSKVSKVSSLEESDMNDRDEVLELFPPPKPTGKVHTWWVDPSLLPVLEAIKDGLAMAMTQHDLESYGTLVDQLVRLPGHPAMKEGDAVEIRVRPPLIISMGHGNN
jgi:hypothetical protein